MYNKKPPLEQPLVSIRGLIPEPVQDDNIQNVQGERGHTKGVETERVTHVKRVLVNLSGTNREELLFRKHVLEHTGLKHYWN